MWQPQGFFNDYVLRSPTILMGKECIRGLYNYPVSKIAVIHGKTFKDFELFKTTFSKKSICFIERSWLGEPDLTGLRGTLAQLEEYKPDTIIAVGGGSVIDGAKMCRLYYEFPYYDSENSRIDGNLFRTKFIVVPTTVGSGAEVSSAAVFVNHDTQSKDMIVMHSLQPDVVVYDTRYVEKTSSRRLLISSMDAMAHNLEGYVSQINNSFIDIFAEKGLSMLHEELLKIIEKQEVNFANLQYAGYLGGVVQNHCIVGAAHAVAHQLTDKGYAHGEAVALLLPAVISLNAQDANTVFKYDKIAHIAGFANYTELIDFIRKVCEVSDLSHKRKQLSGLLTNLSMDSVFCDNVKKDKGGKGNPVDITDEYIVNLAGRI